MGMKRLYGIVTSQGFTGMQKVAFLKCVCTVQGEQKTTIPRNQGRVIPRVQMVSCLLTLYEGSSNQPGIMQHINNF